MTGNTIDHFQRYIRASTSQATARRYGIAVRSFLEWFKKTGIKDLGTAPSDLLSQYVGFLVESQYQPATVQSHLAGVFRYLRWLKERRGLPVATFSKPEMPKHKRKVRDILHTEGLHRFFHFAQKLDEPIRTAVLLLPCSGLRSEEMVSLPLRSFKRVPYRQADGTTAMKLVLLVRGKGGHERVVPLLDEGEEPLLAYLQGWRRTQPDTRWLFPGGNADGHVATRTMRKAVQLIRKYVGQEFTPHTMRRTYLTMLYRQGVDLKMLADIAGHADVQVLIDHYLRTDETDVVNAVHGRKGAKAF